MQPDPFFTPDVEFARRPPVVYADVRRAAESRPTRQGGRNVAEILLRWAGAVAITGTLGGSYVAAEANATPPPASLAGSAARADVAEPRLRLVLSGRAPSPDDVREDDDWAAPPSTLEFSDEEDFEESN